MRPIDVVRRACPKARASYLNAIENGDALFKKAGITTTIRLAHFLAQICHETRGLTIERESGNYRAERILQIFGEGRHSAAVTPDEAELLAGNGPALFERVYGIGNPRKKDLGNTQPGDGWKYRGGGLMQTTGRANYRRMGQKCGVDFEAHPELVLGSAHALKPALAEWTEGKLNAAADLNDIRAITKKINGGYNGLADRMAWFARILPLIDTVTLKDGPAVKAEEASAGAVIVATGSAAAAASGSGYGSIATAAIVIGGVLLAATVYVFIKKWREKWKSSSSSLPPPSDSVSVTGSVTAPPPESAPTSKTPETN